jgi:hypothetical protein
VLQQQMFKDGAEAERRKEGERPDDENYADEQHGELTGKVPGDGGTLFFSARFPANASMGTIIRNRPASIVKPRLMLYQGVLAFNPANADPLLPAAEVNA